MPNHIHGIMFLDEQQSSLQESETHNYASLRKNTFKPSSKNLGSAIRAFKSSFKRYCNQNDIEFNWQPNYYEHIIRNEKDLLRIQEYILNNPAKWEEDRYHE
jgi:putative transposase